MTNPDTTPTPPPSTPVSVPHHIRHKLMDHLRVLQKADEIWGAYLKWCSRDRAIVEVSREMGGPMIRASFDWIIEFKQLADSKGFNGAHYVQTTGRYPEATLEILETVEAYEAEESER